MIEKTFIESENPSTYLIVPDGDDIEHAKWVAKVISESGSMLPKSEEEMLALFGEGRSVILINLDGNPVAHGGIMFVFEQERAVEIGGIIVNPEMRGRGYGKQIIEAVIDLARLKYPEYTRIALCNDLSLPIFLKTGATVVGFDELEIDSSEALSECVNCPRYKTAKQQGKTCCDTLVIIS